MGRSKIRISARDTVCYDCRYLSATQKDCTILKKLYCRIEPDKKCSWYKKKLLEERGQ